MPLPMMQLIISAARLQRPMARTSVGCVVAGCIDRSSGTAGLYHKCFGGSNKASISISSPGFLRLSTGSRATI
jgi:hypothetical protein